MGAITEQGEPEHPQLPVIDACGLAVLGHLHTPHVSELDLQRHQIIQIALVIKVFTATLAAAPFLL